MTSPLAIVTATTDLHRAADCIASWLGNSVTEPKVYPLVNGPGSEHDYLGSVPAFRRAVDRVLRETEAPIIACLHDDFRIDEVGWDEKVIRHFDRYSRCGLAGFGGAVGLGDIDLYQKPYDPMQLARVGFRSNLDDAESHGLRSLLSEPVACLDGFSQIGRRAFFEGYRFQGHALVRYNQDDGPWQVLETLGFMHHFYDGALGCLAKRYGWQTWYLPVRGHHFGGRTAVGDQGYANWAKTQVSGGDQGFWEAAHRTGYESFRNELPIRL